MPGSSTRFFEKSFLKITVIYSKDTEAATGTPLKKMFSKNA